ncbi:MAG: dihydroorotate dehydrogenase electron transfer subunit [Candidatus Omnitrophica bacterium]|nr:dihydroorotate dehydrogenase electron transfer subunit [Candidatus Omnitrophota bacterium]MBD3268742.1 dihydroorotate dehydrogenase electron transfer subunit [Candidatus Omnitrophota bacterium]
MMKKTARQLKVKVAGNEKVKENIYRLSFRSDYLSKHSLPGNFIHIKIENTVLRRPFSVHDIKGDKVYVLFKVRGKGTRFLSEYKRGRSLDVIGPLGRGFSLKVPGESLNIIIAGGIGVAPLVFLARKIGKRGQRGNNLAILGFENTGDIVCEEEFRRLAYKVYISTEDGSRGEKGNSVGILKRILSGYPEETFMRIYACGPKDMFFEINKTAKKFPNAECEVSFEQFMGCGLGVCCACVIETKTGYRKICRDGPVFDIKEIW